MLQGLVLALIAISTLAALLCGLDRATFLMRLSESGVPMIDLPTEELADDIRHAGGT